MKKVRLLSAIIGLSLLFAVPVHTFIHQKMDINVASETTRLQKYKQKAIEQINEVDLSLYREAEALEINELINETTTKINNCETIEEIQSVVSSFNRYLLTIKTDEQLSKEEAENQQEEAQTIYYISSYEELLEFRDDVNDGYSYSNETVVLKEDIVIPTSKPFTTPIGNTTTKMFSGTFDGQNHKIKGLKLSAITCAFIYFGTNCTIKNLYFEDVNINATTQRAAAVISRAENVTIDNVHVLSGTITGAKENGGIVGTALGGVTITNCTNNANITSSSCTNGGIIGFVYNNNATITNCKNYGMIQGGVVDVTPNATNRTYVAFLGGIAGRIDSTGTLNISGCENHGTVTMTATAGIGAGGIFGANMAGSTINISNCTNDAVITGKEATAGIMGQLRSTGQLTIENSINNGEINGSTTTGGILGASIANSSASITIQNCDNHGSVSGTTYVGGIAGLPRKAKAESAIIGCNNYGDVTSTGQGCGGVVALARINVTNCGCYYDATISFKGNPIKASTLNANGGSSSGSAGWITSLVQNDSSNSNGAVMSGERLIKLDGTDY